MMGPVWIAGGGVAFAVMVQAVAFVWWASRVTSRLDALEEFKGAHTSIKEDIASIKTALHDMRGGMQRIENRMYQQHAAGE